MSTVTRTEKHQRNDDARMRRGDGGGAEEKPLRCQFDFATSQEKHHRGEEQHDRELLRQRRGLSLKDGQQHVEFAARRGKSP